MPKKECIGLDIGSSGVRAAEVWVDGDKRVLRRFAQVGLPAGAVVEGEVHDASAVTAAIKKLWEHGGFSGNRVVLGLGSQRAMVRQVEMPAMVDAELRSALRFKIGEYLPIPVEQAIVDFGPVPGGSDGDGRKVLLLAAQREVVVDEVAAVEASGLRVEAVDSSSLALLRASRGPAETGDNGDGGSTPGLEAVVGIGGELITVVVKDGGAPRFVRTVAHAGPSSQPGEGPTPRPRPARRPVNLGSSASSSAVTIAPAPRIDAIVNEVRSSFEYLLAQSGNAKFDKVLVTGGGAMALGVIDALSAAIGLPVQLAEPAVEIDKKALALDPSMLEEASYRWLTAIGLALWGTDAYGKPSLLPEEVAAKRNQRRALFTASGAICALALVLGSVSVGKVHSADVVTNKINTADREAAGLQARIRALGYVTRVPAEMQARRDLATIALYGDIDWTGALQNIERTLPANVEMQTLGLTKSTTSPTAPSLLTASSMVGTFSMTASSKGGAAAVAQFIDRFSHDRDLYGLWVSSTTNALGTTEIQATGLLTGAVLNISRVAALPGGNK